jgi:two-component system, NarL family, sensor histidine kinase UhpB
VARHAAGATAVKVVVSVEAGVLELRVEDNGRGLPPGVTPATVERPGHMGITGMRERIGTLGGSVSLESAPDGGVRLRVRVPLAGPPSP